MAQPPAYNRDTDFARNAGSNTDHTALNAELDRASNSINDIRKNLAILQADDGRLRAGMVGMDALEGAMIDFLAARVLQRLEPDFQAVAENVLQAKAYREDAALYKYQAQLEAERAAESAAMAAALAGGGEAA